LSVLILVGLFLVQRKGTGFIGHVGLVRRHRGPGSFGDLP
jgi:hypothetical protein